MKPNKIKGKASEKNPVRYLKENRVTVEKLAAEGRLSPLQIVICREMGLFEGGDEE